MAVADSRPARRERHRPRRNAARAPPARPPTPRRGSSSPSSERVLWLAVRMIHEANLVRPNPDGLKVGGHQASSASMVSILTALLPALAARRTTWSRSSPTRARVYHALRYLWATSIRRGSPSSASFGGLQSYPSRTKDPDRVDFSTGSVGPGRRGADVRGARRPLPAARTSRDEAAAWPDRRFVATVGDAELDEGNVWEAVLEEPLAGPGQRDRARGPQPPEPRPGRARASASGALERMFAAAGWQVLEAKYGRRLQARLRGSGGETLRRRIDDMPNEEYQALIRCPARRPASGSSTALTRRTGGRPRAGARRRPTTTTCRRLIADLGGHDVDELVRVLDEADADRTGRASCSPTPSRAGGCPSRAIRSTTRRCSPRTRSRRWRRRLGADADDPWAAFAADSPEGGCCAGAAVDLRLQRHPRPAPQRIPVAPRRRRRPDRRPATSTQQVLGDVLAALARDPSIGERIVTASPDVAVSTNLGGWINRVGRLLGARGDPSTTTRRGSLRWQPGPTGQHIELGISEMNLFMWLSQFGPHRGAVRRAAGPASARSTTRSSRAASMRSSTRCTSGRDFILVATPSGVTLAPEGGAHQSTSPPRWASSCPGCGAYEPAFAQEARGACWRAIRGCLDGDERVLHVPAAHDPSVDQALRGARRATAGRGRVARGRCSRAAIGCWRPVGGGACCPLTARSSRSSRWARSCPRRWRRSGCSLREEVAASLVVVTSADRLAAELPGRRLARSAAGPRTRLGHLARSCSRSGPPGARW